MKAEDYMRLPKKRLAELLEERDRLSYQPVIIPSYEPPCYAAGGICTNPQMDCINCPRRGGGYGVTISLLSDNTGEKK